MNLIFFAKILVKYLKQVFNNDFIQEISYFTMTKIPHIGTFYENKDEKIKKKEKYYFKNIIDKTTDQKYRKTVNRKFY